LISNQIGYEGAEALANAPHLSNLTTLNLGRNQIGANGIKALFNGSHLTNLTELNLEEN